MNYYDINAKKFFDGTVNAYMTPQYNEFLSKIPKNGNILDLGCGSGRDTKLFNSLGFNVTAIDGSIEMCKLASEHSNINVKHMQFQEIKYKCIFDGIWASASLLHVPSDEIKIILYKLKNSLKNNGILYASFKYGDFEGMRNGRYFYDLTEDSAIDLFEKTGFKIIKIWFTIDVRPERNEKWINVLVKK